MFNPVAGLVSKQYHLVFDDEFTTLPSLRSGLTLSNWTNLCNNQAHHVSHEDTTIDLAETSPPILQHEMERMRERGE